VSAFGIGNAREEVKVFCEGCQRDFRSVIEVFKEFVEDVTYKDSTGVLRVALEKGDFVDDLVMTTLRRIEQLGEE